MNARNEKENRLSSLHSNITTPSLHSNITPDPVKADVGRHRDPVNKKLLLDDVENEDSVPIPPLITVSITFYV